MKKRIVAFIIAIIMAFGLCGCNYAGYDFADTNYHFDKAIIKMPNGDIEEVEVKKWADAEGEQLTITDTDGNRYLVSSINCILIEEAK